MALSAGTVVADRFEIRAVAGRGGMSVVYRALDRSSGAEIALKVTDCDWEAGVPRFAREARVLSELLHPGIVRYLGHGATPEGDHYLAMEWLDGEDLSAVLRRRPLEIDECVALGRRVAEALDFAHRHGVIHRDVKPSNVFLPGGRIDEAKLLDFGVARLRQPLADLTRTGVALGTPAYMSPEQAHGARDVGPGTDVYSLGCVLFVCLTRKKPFEAENLAVQLAKAVLEERPRPSRFRAGVPPELDDLVHRMIAPFVRDRPADLAAVLEALGAVLPAPGGGQASTAPASISDEEQRLHALVLAHRADREEALLARVAAAYGGHLRRLDGGVLVIEMSARHAATDLAVRAARCALAVRAEAPGLPLAIATGRDAAPADASGTSTILDRAARALPDTSDDATRPAIGGVADGPGGRHIGVDEITAGLLDGRFEIARAEGRLVLVASRAPEAGARTLLGKPTACVARAAELGTLEAMLRACVEEREPKAALVTAPAGVGKSRLRHELLARVSRAGLDVEVVIGHGDPLGAGAPYRILAGALRRAAGILDGEAPAAQREKLAARVSRDLDGDADLARVIEFAGELLGVPFPDEESVQLRAARQDPRLMGDRTRWAVERWIAGACARAPVLLVLEDLHWGDPSTVQLLDALLERLDASPFMVLALARPEVEDLFPRLFAARGVHHIRLSPLGERACRQLVEQVLGPHVASERVDSIIRRAAGNALCLEELIRATAAGGSDDLPETVLAIVQARLEKLEPDARRVLRAASVLGRRFWEGAVCALLGEGEREIAAWLDVLEAEEIVLRHESSLFPGARELSFRHDLMRDAAYAMLTDRDRRSGHRLAAAWLERAGEAEALVLAEHLERGGELTRASRFYLAAAQKALAGNDFAASLAAAERALACRPSAAELGALRLVQAEALAWLGRFVEASARGLEALSALAPGSAGWYGALGEVALASGVQGDGEQLVALAQRVLERDADQLDERAIAALTRLSEQLVINGRIEQADALLALLDRRADTFDARNPGIVARILSAKGLRALFDGDTGENLELVRAASARFAEAGDERNECIKRERVGYSMMDLGAYGEAEHVLRGALETAARLGLANVAATARHNLGLTLARLGRFEEAVTIELEAAQAFAGSGNRRMEGAAFEYLALIRLEAGDAAGAEEDARRALERAREPTLLPLNEAESLAILARTLLAQGRAEEALEAARAGLEGLERLGGIDDGEAIIRLAWAEALSATGALEQAREATRAARERLLHRAGKIVDPRWKESFLANVPENARTLARAAD